MMQSRVGRPEPKYPSRSTWRAMKLRAATRGAAAERALPASPQLTSVAERARRRESTLVEPTPWTDVSGTSASSSGTVARRLGAEPGTRDATASAPVGLSRRLWGGSAPDPAADRETPADPEQLLRAVREPAKPAPKAAGSSLSVYNPLSRGPNNRRAPPRGGPRGCNCA